MHSLGSQKGQLLFPMLAFLWLSGIFVLCYTRWCEAVYWQMRMDWAAEAVALSAARAQAGGLNTIASAQTLENVSLQKAKVFGADVAHLQIGALQAFQENNAALRSAIWGFNGFTLRVANEVAKQNGAEGAPMPSSIPGHHLEAQKVNVFCFDGIIPCGEFTFDRAYYLRRWGAGILKAQPDHIISWGVRAHRMIGVATARVWLDVSPGDVAGNGGFPGKGLPWYRNVGIQCFYPNFNARLVGTPAAKAAALRAVLERR